MSSKTRHILETNLIIEKRFLVEQKPDHLIDRQSNAIVHSAGIRSKKDYDLVKNNESEYTKVGSDQPLHFRAAIKFMVKSKTPLTNQFLSQTNISTLQDILCNKSKLQKTCDSNKWSGVNRKNLSNQNSLHYDDYTMKYPKSPSYQKTTFTYNEQPTNIRELMLTIGSSTVKTSGNSWVIDDVYNFDNILAAKPHLKTNSFFGILKNQTMGLFKALISLATGRSIAAGLEEFFAQYHNMGYPGFKTKLVIPMGNCKCKTTPQ